MATIFIEGFDKYGPSGVYLPNITTSLGQGGWSVVTGGTNVLTPAITGSLNGQAGYAVSLGMLTDTELFCGITKTLPQSYGRLIGGFRMSTLLVSNANGVIFFDGNTAQCAIVFQQTSGTIAIYSGNGTTLLQQGTASVASGVEHYVEFDITFGGTGVGGWTVWLDGVQVLSGSGITIKSANSSANVIAFGCSTLPYTGGVTSTTLNVDDVYLFDSTTTRNNAVLLTNPLVLTDYPVSDVQTQFANIGNVFGNVSSESNNGVQTAANSIWLAPYTPNVNAELISVGIQLEVSSTNNNGTIQLEGVVYSDNSGAPGSLLSGGTITTRISSGEFLTLTLTTPISVVAGTQYWIGIITNGVLIFQRAGTGGSSSARYGSATFSSGPPSTAPTMTNSGYPIMSYGLCSGATTNWESLALPVPVGDASAVNSSVAGTEDLYAFPNLPGIIQQVYTIAVSGYAHLSGSGTHKFDLVAKSGSTSGNGNNTNIAPTTTYAWYDSLFETDPNTGLSWTITAINAADFGMTITV